VTRTIARLQADFSARLTELLAGVRERIAACWDEMRAGERQRGEMFAAFAAPAPAPPSEEFYLEHERYLAHLRTSLEDMRPIIRGVEKREELLRDRGEYAAMLADASRLLARGSSAARLREEKLERRVKKELPAVVKKLREQIKDWEAATGCAFLMNGARCGAAAAAVRYEPAVLSLNN